jgi:peptide/nickel transport system permease protein
MTGAAATVPVPVAPRARGRVATFLRRHPTVAIGGALLALIVLASLAAPWLGTVDPIMIDPSHRLRSPSAENWFGTDRFGRDLYSRVIYGGRVSLVVGLSVAALATVIGLAIGLVGGYLRAVDAVVMRVMDGMMAIPAIMLAIALIALSKASILIVIVAVTLPEVPRVVRLVRSVVLTIREHPTSRRRRRSARACRDHAAPPVAQRAAAADRAGDLHLRVGGVDRGRAELPRRGHAAGDPELGQHHGRGASLLSAEAVMVLLPGLFLAVTVLAIKPGRRTGCATCSIRGSREECDERRRAVQEPRNCTPPRGMRGRPSAGARHQRPAHALSYARRCRQGGGRRVAVARRAIRWRRRRERLRQIRHRAVGHAARAADVGPHRRRQHPLRRQELLTLEPAAMRALRGNRIGMIFQEPMTSLNPVMTVGRQIAESVALHQQLPRSAALDRAIEMLTLVKIPSPGGAPANIRISSPAACASA